MTERFDINNKTFDLSQGRAAIKKALAEATSIEAVRAEERKKEQAQQAAMESPTQIEVPAPIAQKGANAGTSPIAESADQGDSCEKAEQPIPIEVPKPIAPPQETPAAIDKQLEKAQADYYVDDDAKKFAKTVERINAQDVKPVTRLDWALSYARVGYKVALLKDDCPPTCKDPECTLPKQGRLLGWLKAATTDENKIRHWWGKYPNANLGILVKGEPIIPIDKDTHNPDKNGKENFNKLQGDNTLPATPTQITNGGIDGGEHLIFKRIPGAKYVDCIKITDDETGEIKETGIDVDGVIQLVVEPSMVHGKTRHWAKELSPLDVQPADMPAWLQAHVIVQPESNTKDTAKDTKKKAIVNWERELPRLIEAVQFWAAKQSGMTRKLWVDWAHAVMNDGGTFEYFHQLCKLCPDYIDEADCWKLWKGITKPNGTNHIDSIFWAAREAGWIDSRKYDLSPEAKDVFADFVPPDGYVLKESGMYYISISRTGNVLEHLFSDFIIPVSFLRPGTNADDSRIDLKVRCIDGVFRSTVIERAWLYDKTGLLIKHLAAMHVRIVADKADHVRTFLSLCVCANTSIGVKRTGWAIGTTANDDAFVGVLPNFSTDSTHRYLAAHNSIGAASIYSKASLAGWNKDLFPLIRKNHYARFMVFAGLAPLLIRFISTVEFGGIHISGPSSWGKTILLMILAGLWGNANIPKGAQGKSYIKMWDGTVGGLKGILAEHNDLPTCLDELGSSNIKDFDNAVYQFTSGEDKIKLTQNSNLRKQLTWVSPIFSTGEISLRQMIEDSGYRDKKNAKAGTLTRIIDLVLKEKPFANKEEANSCKKAASKNFGNLGPEFMQWIADDHSLTEYEEKITRYFESALTRLKAGRDSFNEVQDRALDTFALIEAAGYLLSESQLIGDLNNDAVMETIDFIVTLWEPSSRSISDGYRGLMTVAGYYNVHQDMEFAPHGSGIAPIKNSDGSIYYYPSTEPPEIQGHVNRPLAGFIDKQNGLIHWLPNRLKEILKGNIAPTIAELKKHELLVWPKSNKKGYQNSVRVNEQPIKVYTTLIKLSGFGEDDEEDPMEQEGNIIKFPSAADWDKVL